MCKMLTADDGDPALGRECSCKDAPLCNIKRASQAVEDARAGPSSFMPDKASKRVRADEVSGIRL